MPSLACVTYRTIVLVSSPDPPYLQHKEKGGSSKVGPFIRLLGDRSAHC